MSSAASQSSAGATAKTPAQLLMDHETRVAFGRVPRTLFDEPLAETAWQMSPDEFLLRGEGEHYFHYRRGAGVTVERGDDADVSEESLWLNGSVYAAIASINGLLPIHASAIAHEGAVIAFAGPAGSGKSTLIAALGQHGLPMFCDDTLILDLSDPTRIVCLPGHKRLKLQSDAIELTGVTREEQVSRTVAKFYAAPAAGPVPGAMPLGELLFLEEGPEPRIIPISGSERFLRMQDDHYTAGLFAAASRFDRASQFAHLGRLAGQITMARFVRPRSPSRFEEGVAMVAGHLLGTAE